MQLSTLNTGRAEGGSRLSPQVTSALVLPALYVLLSTTGDTRVGKGFIAEVRNSLVRSDLNLLFLLFWGFPLLSLGPGTFTKSHFSVVRFDYLVISNNLDLFKLH